MLRTLLKYNYDRLSQSFLLPILFMTLLVVGCSGKVESTDRESAEKLFRKELSLIKEYTDSINAARDSAKVCHYMDTLTILLTEVNYSNRADLDLSIPEGGNIKLAVAIDSLVKLKNIKLYRFAHPESKDSIPDEEVDDKHHSKSI